MRPDQVGNVIDSGSWNRVNPRDPRTFHALLQPTHINPETLAPICSLGYCIPKWKLWHKDHRMPNNYNCCRDGKTKYYCRIWAPRVVLPPTNVMATANPQPQPQISGPQLAVWEEVPSEPVTSDPSEVEEYDPDFYTHENAHLNTPASSDAFQEDEMVGENLEPEFEMKEPEPEPIAPSIANALEPGSGIDQYDGPQDDEEWFTPETSPEPDGDFDAAEWASEPEGATEWAAEPEDAIPNIRKRAESERHHKCKKYNFHGHLDVGHDGIPSQLRSEYVRIAIMIKANRLRVAPCKHTWKVWDPCAGVPKGYECCGRAGELYCKGWELKDAKSRFWHTKPTRIEMNEDNMGLYID